MTTVCALALSIALSQTGSASHAPAPADQRSPAADYTIGPEDVLQVEVFQLEELTASIRLVASLPPPVAA